MPEEYAPMPYLGAVLGLRWGECAGLRVGRIDFLRGTLTIVEQVTRGPHGAVVEGPTKSKAGMRTVSAPRWLIEMLAHVLERRRLSGADVEERLFPDTDGGPLDYGNWRHRVWLPATRAAGLKGLRFHDLRSACATAMVADGVDVRTAQARLGHSDPRLTLEIYTQVSTEADRLAAERLGERFLDRGEQRRESTGDETNFE